LLIAPDDVMAHNNMGIALANLGRYEAAGRHFQEVVKIDPHHAEARKNLAYVRSKINN
jgi:Flp pilus assembly protein TadD